jgi:hypothetical protein
LGSEVLLHALSQLFGAPELRQRKTALRVSDRGFRKLAKQANYLWSLAGKFPPGPVDREPDQQYEEANRC